MAKILYRQTLTPVEPGAVSAGSAVKGSPLTLAEGDYNYKALNDDIQARAALSGATFTGAVSGTSLQMSGAISGASMSLQNALPVASGGTGQTTPQGARTNFGATTLGSNLFTVANPSAISFVRINADNTVSTLDAASFRTAIGAGTSSTVGTVTSVGGTGTVSGLSLSGSVTSSGNITLGGTLSVVPSNFASQSANTVLIAPNGSAGVPTFRTLVAADIPTLNQNTTGTAQNVTGVVAIANGGTGGANGTDARKLINRSAYLGIGSATTLEAGKIYGVWTGGGSYTCTLPSAATAVVGDVIECVDYNLSSNTWAINNWTLGCPANTYINNLAESMTIDVTGRITITCTYSDGTNKYWNVTLG